MTKEVLQIAVKPNLYCEKKEGRGTVTKAARIIGGQGQWGPNGLIDFTNFGREKGGARREMCHPRGEDGLLQVRPPKNRLISRLRGNLMKVVGGKREKPGGGGPSGQGAGGRQETRKKSPSTTKGKEVREKKGGFREN